MALSLNLEALPPNWEQAKEEDRLSYSIAILLRPKKQPPIISWLLKLVNSKEVPSVGLWKNITP